MSDLLKLAQKAKDARAKGEPRPGGGFKRGAPQSPLETYKFDYNVNVKNVEEFVRNKKFASQYIGTTWAECATIIDHGVDHEILEPLAPDAAESNDPVQGPLVRIQYQTFYSAFVKETSIYASN